MKIHAAIYCAKGRWVITLSQAFTKNELSAPEYAGGRLSGHRHALAVGCRSFPPPSHHCTCTYTRQGHLYMWHRSGTDERHIPGSLLLGYMLPAAEGHMVSGTRKTSLRRKSGLWSQSQGSWPGSRFRVHLRCSIRSRGQEIGSGHEAGGTQPSLVVGASSHVVRSRWRRWWWWRPCRWVW